VAPRIFRRRGRHHERRDDDGDGQSRDRTDADGERRAPIEGKGEEHDGDLECGRQDVCKARRFWLSTEKKMPKAKYSSKCGCMTAQWIALAPREGKARMSTE
jgi:hypothetical protein